MAGVFQIDGVIPRIRETPRAEDGVPHSVPLPAALSDLVALDAKDDDAESAADPSHGSKAVAALHREVTASISPPASCAESDPISKASVRLAPRLERIPTLAIRPAPTIARRLLESGDLKALATSIKRNGLAQPLLVRANPAHPGIFELFAGYRRWRAALVADIAFVPAIVFLGLSDAAALELGLLENLHRRDLTIIEEADAFRLLIERFGRTHQQIAVLAGRSRSQITNVLRLLALPEEVKDILHKGRIRFGHGRALLGAADPAALARRIVAERLTVRETQLLAAQVHATALSGAGMPAPSRSSPSLVGPLLDGSHTVSGSQQTVSPHDLRMLQAELDVELGMQLEVRVAPEQTALIIRGRSGTDVASIVAALRNGLKSLRMSRPIVTLSRPTGAHAKSGSSLAATGSRQD